MTGPQGGQLREHRRAYTMGTQHEQASCIAIRQLLSLLLNQLPETIINDQ